ncbi:SDR family oxidoreductase [Halobaculum sp. MBLA0147]|uniref:SDR family oxidoreductase n=1 Tax=Halobaculum sp. MBLA0147 TaxID=3079934 RepID=UPI0035260F21
MTTTDRPVAVITGASRGIGAATARRLGADGYDLVLAARSENTLQRVASEVAREHDVTAHAVPTDVTDPDEVAALAETTVDRLGRIDVTVVNAGVGERRNVPLDELSLSEYETVRATNVDGAFYTARATLPALRDTEGTLVFLGSYKGKFPSTSTPVYAASKWWLRGFAHSLAGRVGPDGVAVSVINPTGVPTSFGRDTRGTPNAQTLDPDATVSAADVADAVATAVTQDAPGAVAELDLFRRDVHERF